MFYMNSSSFYSTILSWSYWVISSDRRPMHGYRRWPRNGSDGPQMGQIWEFLRWVFSRFVHSSVDCTHHIAGVWRHVSSHKLSCLTSLHKLSCLVWSHVSTHTILSVSPECHLVCHTSVNTILSCLSSVSLQYTQHLHVCLTVSGQKKHWNWS